MGMGLSPRRVDALLGLMRELAHLRAPDELRAALGRDVLALFEADYFASYAWDEAASRFGAGVFLNMDPANLATYDAYYQFHDPITHKLKARRRATAVVEVMAQEDLVRTEFFNDFLGRDGLWWGMNVYAYAQGRNLGDLRIWRSRQRENFSRDDLRLLGHVGAAFTAALAGADALEAGRPGRRLDANRLKSAFGLTAREAQVAALVARGAGDAEVAVELSIGLATVRTHLGRVFDKTGTGSRAALAARLLD